jgi:hypothetical protein
MAEKFVHLSSTHTSCSWRQPEKRGGWQAGEGGACPDIEVLRVAEQLLGDTLVAIHRRDVQQRVARHLRADDSIVGLGARGAGRVQGGVASPGLSPRRRA